MLYFDLTRCAPAGKTINHGGANYIKIMLLDLIEFAQKNKINEKIVLLYNKESEDIVLNTCFPDELQIQLEKIDTEIFLYNFEKKSTVFLPLLAVKRFFVLKKLKEKGLKVILTIHGLRLLDDKYDRFDKMYIHGIKQYLLFYADKTTLVFRKLLYILNYKHYLRYCDTLILVSNFTLSRIVKYVDCNTKILLQYESTFVKMREQSDKKTDSGYMLFVSGNRAEKNLARTVVAYKKYSNMKNAMPLYVTGVNDEKKNILIKSLNIQRLVNEKRIVFFEYLSDEKLVDLYDNASFLVYTSKSEGFGLPPLEAAYRSCPSIVSIGTSVPEVLGECCVYVNPYSIESICNGMNYLSITENRRLYAESLNGKVVEANCRANRSNDIIFSSFFEKEK